MAVEAAMGVAKRELGISIDPVDEAFLHALARSEIAQALPSQCLPRAYAPLWHESQIEGGHTPRTRVRAHRVMVAMRGAFTMAYPSLIKPARWQSMPNLRRLLEDLIAAHSAP